MKNLKHLILYITFFQIFANINCQQYVVPKGRIFHTAALIGTKIYYLGGQNNESLLTNDFFYLDISKSFNNTEGSLPFVNVTLGDSVPEHYGATTVVFGKFKESIFFFGGDMGTLQNTESLVYILNTTQLPLAWKNMNVPNNEIERRRFLSAVADNNNKNNTIYFFGGGGGGKLGDNLYIRYDTMNIFNSTTSNWTYGTIDNTIIKREGHTATFLSDTGEIVYIGGNSDNGLMNMANLDVYNTKSRNWNKWETKNPPEQRYYHTAILTNDNRIIVFGGVKASKLPVENYYVVLDLKTREWYHGNGTIIGAPYRGHTATFHDDHMFIAFGQGTTKQASNDIHIYKIGDYANFTEVEQYNKIYLTDTTVIRTIVIPIIILVTTLGFIVFVVYRYNKARRMKGMKPPRDTMSEP
ncbi:unnamed protein product [Rhizophagus irregularis]|nr:unnamed protein product [Rhizophagus irregularis]CAB5351871.1 unnamed protein product [Rhizophagus irregularis]